MLAGTDEAALKRGADDLENRLEYMLRSRPRALKRARQRYTDFCLQIYCSIERAAKVRQ